MKLSALAAMPQTMSVVERDGALATGTACTQIGNEKRLLYQHIGNDESDD
jgi:peptide deformylase